MSRIGSGIEIEIESGSGIASGIASELGNERGLATRRRIARAGLLACALWGTALGATALGVTGGCAVTEEDLGEPALGELALGDGTFERDVRPPRDADAPSAPSAPHLATTSTIVPILLIPTGSAQVTGNELRKLREALGNVRQWYQRELPNKDLRWDTLKVLQGQKTATYYLQNNNVWAEMPGEIQAAFGWNPWDNTGNNHVALVIGRDRRRPDLHRGARARRHLHVLRSAVTGHRSTSSMS